MHKMMTTQHRRRDAFAWPGHSTGLRRENVTVSLKHLRLVLTKEAFSCKRQDPIARIQLWQTMRHRVSCTLEMFHFSNAVRDKVNAIDNNFEHGF